MKNKRVFSGGEYQWEGGGHKKMVNEGEYDECILYSYMKNTRMKPVEIFLRRGEGWKTCCPHVWKLYL
jgi:hypothetical protein